MCERVDGRTVNRKVLEALIKSGACDCFGETRATLFAQIDRTLARAASIISGPAARPELAVRRARGKAPRTMPEAISQLAGMAPARIARARKRTARVLRHRPSADAFCAASWKNMRCTTRARLAQLQTAALTRIGGMIAAVQHGVLKEERQTLRHGHAGRSRRHRAGALHERELRQIPRAARAEQSHSRHRRSQQRRRQAQDFSAGNHAAGRRAAPLYQAGSLAPAYGAPDAGPAADHSATSSTANPGKCPLFLCLCMPDRRNGVHGNARTIFRRALARNCSRPPTNCSAKRPITPRWTRLCPNARPAAGNERRRTATASDIPRSLTSGDIVQRQPDRGAESRLAPTISRVVSEVNATREFRTVNFFRFLESCCC